ncbi:hypothetical protein QJS83_08110 [Bdellovibrio sp. 22V]|uniref:hypothetical protein n=1 Tax=Bdellovibrio TaxID=958 RepID=UPI0025434411|nr:hypothetical protein [Bdellovibrio sp. 22V]WII73840.1 hypothetical protein QJS83_08110 [Bdellovibrio sp. 22V]
MKVLLRALAPVFVATAMVTTAEAAPSQFVGTWVNMNSKTQGIVKFTVDTNMKIHLYGACAPTPCDIGQTNFYTNGTHVADMNHKAATAIYNLSFKQMLVTFKLSANSGRVYMEHYNRFTDNSGRQNYWMGERFRKVSTMVEVPDAQRIEPEN